MASTPEDQNGVVQSGEIFGTPPVAAALLAAVARSEANTAALARDLESLARRLDVQPPPLPPPPSPPRSRASAVPLEGSGESRLAPVSETRTGSRQSQSRVSRGFLLEQMAEKIRVLEQKQAAGSIAKAGAIPHAVQLCRSPFTQRVLSCPLPQRFRPPAVDLFDGSGDPCDHVEVFTLHMHIHSYADPIFCRAFSLTLKGPARRWFSSLPTESIDNFDTLNALFISQHSSGRRAKKPSSYLMGIKQGPRETLRAYLTRFNHEAVSVSRVTDDTKLLALTAGLQPGDFLRYLLRKNLTDFGEVMRKAQEHIDCEDMFAARVGHSQGDARSGDNCDRGPERSSSRSQRYKRG